MIPLLFPSSKHKYCHLCGKPLVLAYTQYSNGLIVCPACERNAPRCAQCQQPARAVTPIDQGHLCQQCLATLPRCAACGKPITGQFYRFGDSSNSYCPDCAEQRPICDVCGVPLGADGMQLAGGQVRCGDCARTIVLDNEAVHALYHLVIQQARSVLDGEARQIPVLQIVEPTELAAVRRRYRNATPPLGGAGQHVLGFFEQHGQARTIYIERGLPRATLIGTLAHEYAHAWQADYTLEQQDTLRREGFAEWLAYRILVAQGHIREAARATRREDEYGRGLRHFIALEQQSGRQSVFTEAGARKTS